MRLASPSGELRWHVGVLPSAPRAIRLRIGPFKFSMSPDEALELAHHLADAVEEFKAPQTAQTAQT
jgi:hypothetical protein